MSLDWVHPLYRYIPTISIYAIWYTYPPHQCTLFNTYMNQQIYQLYGSVPQSPAKSHHEAFPFIRDETGYRREALSDQTTGSRRTHETDNAHGSPGDCCPTRRLSTTKYIILRPWEAYDHHIRRRMCVPPLHNPIGGDQLNITPFVLKQIPTHSSTSEIYLKSKKCLKMSKKTTMSPMNGNK